MGGGRKVLIVRSQARRAGGAWGGERRSHRKDRGEDHRSEARHAGGPGGQNKAKHSLAKLRAKLLSTPEQSTGPAKNSKAQSTA